MTRGRSFALKLGLTGAVLAVLAATVDVGAMGPALRSVDLTMAPAVIAIGIVQVAALAARWLLVARYIGVSLSPGAAWQGTLVSMFFSQGLPASIGGDVFRIWWLTSQAGASPGAASHAVFVDRISGFVALVGLCAVSIVLIGSHLDGPASDALRLVFALCILGTLVVMLPTPRWLRELWGRLLVRLPARARDFLLWLAELRRLFVLLMRDPGALAANLGIGLFVHMLSVLMAYLVVRAFDLELSFEQCLAVVPLALLVAYMPISIAGWGTREASMIFGFGLFGLPAAVGLLVSVTIGVVILAISLLGGLLWIGTAMRSTYRRSQAVDANR